MEFLKVWDFLKYSILLLWEIAKWPPKLALLQRRPEIVAVIAERSRRCAANDNIMILRCVAAIYYRSLPQKDADFPSLNL